MIWVHGALAGLSMAIGGLHLFRAVRLRSGRVLEAAYAAMALGMAAMFSPVGDPVPGPAWAVLFALSGAWFGAVLLRFRSPGVLDGEALHVVVGSAAMLFMLGAHQAGGVEAHGGHAAHGGGAPGMVGVASAVALVFAGLLRAAHAALCRPPAHGPRRRAGPAQRAGQRAGHDPARSRCGGHRGRGRGSPEGGVQRYRGRARPPADDRGHGLHVDRHDLTAAGARRNRARAGFGARFPVVRHDRES